MSELATLAELLAGASNAQITQARKILAEYRKERTRERSERLKLSLEATRRIYAALRGE